MTLNAIGIFAQTGNPGQITDKLKACLKVVNLLRRGNISTFNYLKGLSGQVTELKHDKPNIPSTIGITGVISTNPVGEPIYNFEIEDKNVSTNTKFENDLSGGYIALKHKQTETIIARAQFERLTSPRYGGRATLKLKDEGEYEILVGPRATP